MSSVISAGDTGFMLICAAFVMIMTPGLAFFYGGLSRRKNVVNTMMMSIATMGLASVLWMICGYSLSFSGGEGGFLGNFKWAFFNNVSMNEPGPYADTMLYGMPIDDMVPTVLHPNDVCYDNSGIAYRFNCRSYEV